MIFAKVARLTVFQNDLLMRYVYSMYFLELRFR